MDNEIKAKTGFHSNMKCIMTSDTKKQRRKFRLALTCDKPV